MNLNQFDKKLRELVPPNSRPFLCEGSPLECDLFVVGNNPGTETPFWEYWKLPYGCRKSLWLKDFWKRHAGEQKPVRRYMEVIFSELSGVNYLETNAYAPWSKWTSDLGKHQLSTEVFEFLLETIQPKLVFAFAAHAKKYLRKKVGREIEDDVATPVKLLGFETHILLTPSRPALMVWGDDKSRAVGKRLRKIFMGLPESKSSTTPMGRNKRAAEPLPVEKPFAKYPPGSKAVRVGLAPSGLDSPMKLTKTSFVEFLVANEGNEFEAKDGTPFTYELNDPSPAYADYFPYSMRVFSDRFAASTKRSPGPKQLAYFLEVFNRNPFTPLDDYRNKDGAGSKAYNAKFVVPLMSKAASGQA